MAYGRKSYRGRSLGKRSFTSGRYSRSKKVSAKRRSSTVSRARRSKPTVSANRTLVRSNAAKIKRLQTNQWGTYQSVTSTLTQPSTGGFIITRDHPLLFEVTNPSSGTHGPDLYTIEHLGNGGTEKLSHTWETYVGEGNSIGDYHEMDRHIPNGPMIRLNWVNLKFKFTGVLTDTRITVHILRQKKFVHDFWALDQTAVRKFFLPLSLQSMRNLAGFTPNTIDRTTFDVLASRKLYLNSEASQQSLDGGINYTMEESTTADTKICNIVLKLNKVLKQLHVSQDEPEGDEDLNVAEAPNPQGGSKGPYKYTNLHPLDTIWCLVSTDDTQTLSDLIPDADGVNRGNLKMECIRKMTWQDKRA